MFKKIIQLSPMFILSIGTLSLSTPYKAAKNDIKIYFDLHNSIAPNLHASFNDYTYSMDLDSENNTAKIDLQISAKTLKANIGIAESRMKSEKVFDVENHPYLTFKSNKSLFSGENLKSVSGNLTLRGISQPITFKSDNFKCTTNAKTTKKVCAGIFKGTLDRTKYNITYPSILGYDKNAVITFEFKNAIEQ